MIFWIFSEFTIKKTDNPRQPLTFVLNEKLSMLENITTCFEISFYVWVLLFLNFNLFPPPQKLWNSALSHFTRLELCPLPRLVQVWRYTSFSHLTVWPNKTMTDQNQGVMRSPSLSRNHRGLCSDPSTARRHILSTSWHKSRF